MLYRFTQIIDEAAKDVPALLWPPSSVCKMKAVVERFPEVQARTIGPVRWGVFGLEFRLAQSAEQVDLTFPILAEDRDVIVRLGQDSSEGGWLREGPVWARVWELCRRWADMESLLGRHIKLLWLELDVDAKATEESLPAPGIFVRFEPETTACSSRATWRRILSDVLLVLGGRAPQPALLENLELCLGSLPPGAFVQYVGLMLARGGDTVRFVFANLSEPDLPGFLEAVSWPGQPEGFLELLQDIATSKGERLHSGPSALQMDIGSPGVLPRLGIEYVLDRSAQIEQGIRELKFLEHLVERELCSAEKFAALLELPGRNLSVWRDLCLIGHSRQVHHIKLVFDSEKISEAKAYYGRALTIQRLTGAMAESISSF
jgi:hypothetical protein